MRLALVCALTCALGQAAEIRVAQIEASAPGWQANPNAVGQCRLVWICGSGSATNFPNTLGTESGHANEVARLLHSVAPGIHCLENYEAGYFTGSVVPNEIPISAKIVNQSFAYFARNNRVDQDYDDYAAKHNVLFVSAAGNGGWVRSPGTAYNSISVGAYGGSSSVGPATDGRCKPDITAAGSSTSFSTPLVSGAATLLLEAGATDIRLLKALLLNGAQKPADWTNCVTSPLDPRYGAGLVNASNACRQFRAGQKLPGTVTGRRGWDLREVSTSQRYSFAFANTGPFTATLVWLRQYGCTNISNLDLTLTKDSGEVVAISRSTLDNVEHVYVANLGPGAYTLEVSAAQPDTYALAFESGSSQPPRLEPWKLTGEPNQTYLIESSIDLRTWTPWVTNTGTFHFDPGTQGPLRFFRARELAY